MSRAIKYCLLAAALAIAGGLAACQGRGEAAGSSPGTRLAQATPTAHTVSYVELGIRVEGRLELVATMTRVGLHSWRVETDVFGHSEEVWQSQAVSGHALRLTAPDGTSLLDLDAGTWTAPIGTLEVLTAR